LMVYVVPSQGFFHISSRVYADHHRDDIVSKLGA
jgi:hypothetical protein